MRSGPAVVKAGSAGRSRSKRLVALGVAALVAMTVLPIGVHTVLLDDLGVPYPASLPKSGWAAVPDHVLLVLGLILFDGLLRRRRNRSPVRRGLTIFLIVGAINQALLRLPIMRNAVSTRWTIYPFVDNLPAVIWYAVAVGLVELLGGLTTTTQRRLAVAAGMAVALDFLLAPATAAAFARIIAADGAREGDQLYGIPYDWHVDLPSYLTFMEPALGALAAALLMRRLRVSPAATTTLLFALQAGPLFRVVLNVGYAPDPPATAIISEGQFALEALALAALGAAFAAALVGKPARPVSEEI